MRFEHNRDFHFNFSLLRRFEVAKGDTGEAAARASKEIEDLLKTADISDFFKSVLSGLLKRHALIFRTWSVIVNIGKPEIVKSYLAIDYEGSATEAGYQDRRSKSEKSKLFIGSEAEKAGLKSPYLFGYGKGIVAAEAAEMIHGLDGQINALIKEAQNRATALRGALCYRLCDDDGSLAEYDLFKAEFSKGDVKSRASRLEGKVRPLIRKIKKEAETGGFDVTLDILRNRKSRPFDVFIHKYKLINRMRFD